MESQVTPNAESSKKTKTESSSEEEIFFLQVSEGSMQPFNKHST